VATPDFRRQLLSAAQRVASTRPGVVTIRRVVSPFHRRVYQLTGGRLSLTGRAPVLLLTTTGRRTGLERTVPLLYLCDDDRLVICNVNPGFGPPCSWTLNLRADPRARAQLGRRLTEVTAREVLDEDDLDRYWPRLVRMWPAYGTYYDRGGRRSVFVLDPVTT
jgi:F420H(2)-dependent quinone reductase